MGVRIVHKATGKEVAWRGVGDVEEAQRAFYDYVEAVGGEVSDYFWILTD